MQSINRENQSRYMTVTATVAEGSNATLLSRELQPLIDAYELPDGYTIDTAGESDMVNQMVIQMSKVLLLGLALIYLGSWWHSSRACSVRLLYCSRYLLRSRVAR